MKTSNLVLVAGRDVQVGDTVFDEYGLPYRIDRLDAVAGMLSGFLGGEARVAYSSGHPMRVISPEDTVVLLLHRADHRSPPAERTRSSVLVRLIRRPAAARHARRAAA